MKLNTTTKQAYKTPETAVLELSLEQCIAQSTGDLNGMDYNDLIDELTTMSII